MRLVGLANLHLCFGAISVTDAMPHKTPAAAGVFYFFNEPSRAQESIQYLAALPPTQPEKRKTARHTKTSLNRGSGVGGETRWHP